MAKRKGSKRGGKKRVKKAVEPAPLPENHEPVVEEEEEVPEEPAVETTVQEAEPTDLDLDDTGSPSTMEPEPSPSLDGDHSKDGSGTESETMHTGFMQTGPNNYRCGSTLIDLTKADEETHFNFKTVPKDIALEVECGGNRAMMYLSKLYQGSKGHCIEFQGNWITPNEFQAVSGRESAKDWKRSIRHHGRSLKLLLSKGVLDVHPAACRCDSCRLLQQSNGKAPSVDGQSGDEKQSKSTTPKKKKKDKDKEKEKEKSEDPIKPKEKEVEEKAEVNGDVPVVNSDTVPLLDKPADDKEANSSSDSSSSSDEEDSSEEESDSEKKPPAKPECLFPEPAEQPKRVEAIKVKIPRNLPTNPESSSSDSSSSGDSSDDDSDDDGSSDEEEQNTETVPPFDPASLNEPLFPSLKPTVIVKKPLPPPKPKKESSSEDDEPLANINRKLNIKLEESKPSEETPEIPPEQDLKKDSEADMVIKASETQQSEVLLDATMKEEVSTEEKMETETEEQEPEPMKMDQLDVMPEDNALKMDMPPPEQESALTTEVNDKPTQNEVDMKADVETELKEEPAQATESSISPPKENGAELSTLQSTEPSVETPVCELAPAPIPQSVEPVKEVSPKAPSPPSSPTPTPDQTTGDSGICNQADMKVNPVTGLPEMDSDQCDGSETSEAPPQTEPCVEQADTKSEVPSNLTPNEVSNENTNEDTKKGTGLATAMDTSEDIHNENSLDTVKVDTGIDTPVDVPTDSKHDCSVEKAPETSDKAMDLSDVKPSAPTPTDIASVTPSVPEMSSDSGSTGTKDSDNGSKVEAESAELTENKAIPAVPPLIPVAKGERKPGGNKLSRLSNIIDNLRVVKEKQVLSGDGEKEDTPERKASPQPLAKSSSLPPQLVPRPEEKKSAGGGSFTPPLPSSASHHSLPHTPYLPQQQVQQQPVHQQSKHQEPQQSQPSASKHHHSSPPSQHRKSSSSSALPPASSSGHSHHSMSSLSSTSHTSSHTASSSSSKSSKPSSSSSSSGATSQPSSIASSQSSSHPSTTSFPTFPSLLSSPLAATSPLLAGGMSTSLMRQQQELALSIQQAMARGTLTNAELGQAQLMAFHMAQNEAALQASYYQKMMEMQKMTSSLSAQSKAERDFQMANLPALMQWHSRPDLLNPFLAHQHLLAAQQQQAQQQMREKELEKEKQKQQQKIREREQQQKREREREREREQQKQRQEHLELKLQQQKLQEQQQQFKQKQLQMMQDQQRKLDAAHTQFQLDMAKRDVSKRSYETMAAGLGLSAAGEQPRKAHTDAKKPRTSLPGSYTTPNLGKPRPSHTKENGSSGSSSSKGSSSSRSSALNLPVPPPVSPVAPPRLWSSSFPHSLPAPSALDMARFYGLSEDAAKHMTSMAAATNSRAAHSASTTSRSAPSASASSTSATASSSASGGSGGGDVLDLSVKR